MLRSRSAIQGEAAEAGLVMKVGSDDPRLDGRERRDSRILVVEPECGAPALHARDLLVVEHLRHSRTAIDQAPPPLCRRL